MNLRTEKLSAYQIESANSLRDHAAPVEHALTESLWENFQATLSPGSISGDDRLVRQATSIPIDNKVLAVQYSRGSIINDHGSELVAALNGTNVAEYFLPPGIDHAIYDLMIARALQAIQRDGLTIEALLQSFREKGGEYNPTDGVTNQDYLPGVRVLRWPEAITAALLPNISKQTDTDAIFSGRWTCAPILLIAPGSKYEKIIQFTGDDKLYLSVPFHSQKDVIKAHGRIFEYYDYNNDGEPQKPFGFLSCGTNYQIPLPTTVYSVREVVDQVLRFFHHLAQNPITIQ